MRFRLGAIALLVQALGGCAWLLGQGELPQPRSPVLPLEPRQTVVDGKLRARADFLGVGERIVTARNPIGRLGRVVNPYGEDTFVVALHVENAGDEAVVLLAGAATLDVGVPPMLLARTLDDYRKRWPAWAVEDAREGEDQAQAYTHVLQTLLLERQVPAGESAEGRLAFPVGPARDSLELRVPYRSSGAKGELRFRWAL